MSCGQTVTLIIKGEDGSETSLVDLPMTVEPGEGDVAFTATIQAPDSSRPITGQGHSRTVAVLHALQNLTGLLEGQQVKGSQGNTG